MIIDSIHVEKFRAINDLNLKIGKKLTVIAGRNGTMKSTLLGMLSQPFSINDSSPLYGSYTLEGYQFKSQFKDKFCLPLEYDHPGDHKWTLNFNKNLKIESYTVVSAGRSSGGIVKSIRFINAKGKKAGMGYIQVPVIYLSLSRLYPIGESGFTKEHKLALTENDKNLFVKWYKEVFSVQSLPTDLYSVDAKKKDSKRFFAGVSDSSHDVLTNSAGETNIGRILLSILSFKKLKEKHNKDYHGGILLIDELDASLYAEAQRKLIRVLDEASKSFNIQFIFTTHSPIILREISKLQCNELRDLPSDLDIEKHDFNYEIIELKPLITSSGRKINGNNIHTANSLRALINEIEMKPTYLDQNIHLYCEDEKAISLLNRILSNKGIDLCKYTNIIPINLGWTNYLHLVEYNVPEFCQSIIILDHDVLVKHASKNQLLFLQSRENVLFLPIDVEKGMFNFLKDISIYEVFEKKLLDKDISLSYEICFKDFTEDSTYEYKTEEYKKWFNDLVKIIKDPCFIFDLWITNNRKICNAFVKEFCEKYNLLAQYFELDYISNSK